MRAIVLWLFPWVLFAGLMPASPLSPGELSEVLSYQRTEHVVYGNPAFRQSYLQTAPGDRMGPSIMQRSGRRRLYDHNLVLRAVFKGSLSHHRDGNLKRVFEDPVFVDIGSAILNGEGAPTCRDLYEDEGVFPFLHRLVATDINDPASRYVDTYFRTRNNLPFYVRAVPLELDTAEKLDGIVRDRIHPLILRSANSGPDLYYSPELLRQHFQVVVDYAGRRPALYFFGMYLLYKPAAERAMEVLGTVDYDIGFNHRWAAWTAVNWGARTARAALSIRDGRLSWVDAERSREETGLAIAANAAPAPCPKEAERIEAARNRALAYKRASDWQKKADANLEAWEMEADRLLAEGLTDVAGAYAGLYGKAPADLGALAKFALLFMRYDYRRLDRLRWNPAGARVEVGP
ncbi:MAG: hypothetical protein J0L75_03005 [Spirochaetes bacterium]|nr:hypothetical protein [Spirochaetota bacterium]